MGLILAPNEIKTNMENLRSYLENMAECYKNVQEKVHEYYSEEQLVAESWLESQYRMEICYLLIAENMTSVQENIIDDIAALYDYIGDEYLDEDELNAQIERLEAQCQSYEERITEINSMSAVLPSAGCVADMASTIGIYQEAINTIKEKIAILKEKLIFLHEAEDLTVNLFQSATDLLTTVRDAINDGGISINGGNSLPDSPGWLTVLSGKDEDSLVIENIEVNGRVVDQIIPKEVIANINGEDRVYYPRENWFALGKEDEAKIGDRYKIAVAPKILIPDYPDDGQLWEDDFEGVSKNIDVVLENKETGEIITIKCVVTDLKAHSYNSYPNGGKIDTGDVITYDIESGIIQTGISYPYSCNAETEPVALENMDASIIEFAGKSIDFSAKDYKFLKLIVEE